MEYQGRELGLWLELNDNFFFLNLRRDPKLLRSSPTLVLLLRSAGSPPVHRVFPFGRPLPLGVSMLNEGEGFSWLR